MAKGMEKPGKISMKTRIHTIGVCLLCACGIQVAAVELHVSPSGDDQNPGTLTEPLQTITAARDIVRGQRSEVGGRRTDDRGQTTEEQSIEHRA